MRPNPSRTGFLSFMVDTNPMPSVATRGTFTVEVVTHRGRMLNLQPQAPIEKQLNQFWGTVWIIAN